MSDLVGVPCSVCSERGHHSRKCPDLTDPLRPGFSGAGGGGGHGGDEEDHLPLVPYLPCLSPIISPTTMPSNLPSTNSFGFRSK